MLAGRLRRGLGDVAVGVSVWCGLAGCGASSSPSIRCRPLRAVTVDTARYAGLWVDWECPQDSEARASPPFRRPEGRHAVDNDIIVFHSKVRAVLPAKECNPLTAPASPHIAVVVEVDEPRWTNAQRAMARGWLATRRRLGQVGCTWL